LERARLLVEQAETLGEPAEDPLLLPRVLIGFWVASVVAFDGDVLHEISTQFQTLAKQRKDSDLLMMAHNLMGRTKLCTGNVVEARAHYDQAMQLYKDHNEHRYPSTRFYRGFAARLLPNRSWALWLLGYPEAALEDAEHALKEARDTDHAASLLTALNDCSWTYTLRGSYAAARSLLDELAALSDQKGTPLWRSSANVQRGWILVLTGNAAEAVQKLSRSVDRFGSTGSTFTKPRSLSFLARAYADLGQFDDAWRCIGEATATIEKTKERWSEADTYRIAGEIALMSPQPDTAKAIAYFRLALDVARTQEAKSWELRAAMSMARLWRHQGKRNEARELLVPVYGWFTEGFDTRDLKEAKALLEELSA
jgi:predicted ATPase